jgi:dsRNA-specific ribonuclease
MLSGIINIETIIFFDYVFLLVLSHFSYGIFLSLQRLEYLGDAVLDYLITVHLYKEYPGMSPGMLTDMRAASVNNDCYARSAIRVQLHKHVLHTSHELHKHIAVALTKYNELSSSSTFGWESDASFPKVSRNLEIILLLS